MICYKDFLKCCNCFLLRELTSHDSSQWKKAKGNQEQSDYLVMHKIVAKNKASTSSTTLKEDSVTPSNILPFLEVNIDPDDSFIAKEIHSYWKFEYHIVYSLAYSIPVLYFNAWDELGVMISHDEVWDCITSYTSMSTSKWESVSQKHHPILGQPFYFFHPCKTADIMDVVRSNADNWKDYYIATWINIYGKALGLSILVE